MNTRLNLLEGLKVAEELRNLNLVDNSLTSLRGLRNLKQVSRKLTIQNNLSLNSLEGLESLISVGGNRIQILTNNYLTNYCALSKPFNEGTFPVVETSENGYNPTVEQIQGDECKGELEY